MLSCIALDCSLRTTLFVLHQATKLQQEHKLHKETSDAQHEANSARIKELDADVSKWETRHNEAKTRREIAQNDLTTANNRLKEKEEAEKGLADDNKRLRELMANKSSPDGGASESAIASRHVEQLTKDVEHQKVVRAGMEISNGCS